jgi:hypothetical protein
VWAKVKYGQQLRVAADFAAADLVKVIHGLPFSLYRPIWVSVISRMQAPAR